MVLVNFEYLMAAVPDRPSILGNWLLELPSGRSSALFVTLAGAGMALMSRGADRRAVRRTLLLRALFLLVAGNLLLLVWWIDILHFYAFYLAIAALFFLRLPAVWLLVLAVVVTAAGIGAELIWPDLSYDAIDYWTPLGMAQDVLAFGIHPVFPWVAFVLVGLWLGQHDLTDTGTRRRLMVIGGVLAVAGPLVGWGLGHVVGLGLLPLALADRLGTDWSPAPLYVLSAAGSSIFLIALAQEAVTRWAGSRIVRAMIVAGQLSFTIYVLHALVGVELPRRALGWDETLPQGWAAAYALAFCVVVVLLAPVYRRHFSRGPLEWLMRRVSGNTPPRIEPPKRVTLAAPRRVGWSIAAAGLIALLGLSVTGGRALPGCPDEQTIGERTAAALSLTCPRRGFALDVTERQQITLETHSAHDLYLEVYDGSTLLYQNDDGGQGYDARLAAPFEPGQYRVVVRPYSASLGSFVLSSLWGPAPPPIRAEGGLCTNTCEYAFDAECDDGGPNSLYDVCELGTDCGDCGAR